MNHLKNKKSVSAEGGKSTGSPPVAEPQIPAFAEGDAVFQTLFLHNPQPMWVFALETLQLLEVNEAAVSHSGHSRDDLLGRRFSDLCTPDEVPRLLREVARARQEGQYRGPWKHLLKDGSVIDVELLAQNVQFRGQEAHLVVGRDITKQKKVEEALRQAEQKYRRIFEEAIVGLFQSTPDGRVLSANPAMARMYGVGSPEEFVAYITDVQAQLYVDPARRVEFARLMKDEGRVRHFEVQVYRKDRSKMWLLVNGQSVLEGDSIVRYEGTAEDITQRKALQDQLLSAEEQYREIFENAVVGIFQSTPEGRYLTANPAMAKMLGYGSPLELVGSITDIARQVYVDPGHRVVLKEQMEKDGAVRNLECQVYRKDRSKAWFSANLRAVFHDGEIVRYEGMNEDITQRKLLEDQLRQSQKMEAVGLLAAGVAHDFNNALGVITGYSDLLQMNLPPGSTSQKQAEEIAKAGRRAAALTRQLLAFSRKQVIQPVALDLNSASGELEKMLRRLIGEHIEVSFRRSPGLGLVKMDASQVEQVLMNLCLNARDAMPDGGKLCVETANVELDETYARQITYVQPGSYVLLSVSDTGCGMAAETQRRIFEPFFTTKQPGKGTGLGLSTVYGIAKQNGGYIIVYSEIGKGSIFRLYLPRLGEDAMVPEATPRLRAEAGGTETVMVVEDEESLRILVCTCLESNGYKVLDAPDPTAALRLAETEGRKIDLLLSDVVMPGMGGRDLANRMLILHPTVKVLYMSGYTNDLVDHHRILEDGAELLEKPFTLQTLLGKISKVLHRTEPGKVEAANSGN